MLLEEIAETLDVAFPDVTFAVTHDGKTLDVRWTDGPTRGMVCEAIDEDHPGLVATQDAFDGPGGLFLHREVTCWAAVREMIEDIEPELSPYDLDQLTHSTLERIDLSENLREIPELRCAHTA